jgi:DNA repair exonuclease SbcCD ATPase subunit
MDSDASSMESESSDDNKKSKKKALASIAINDKPSLFDTPSTCLMAKPTKVKYDECDDDCESNDYRSDDEQEEDSKEALMDMLENAHTCLEMKRKECKELRKELKALKQSFDELNASHESLKEDHEELGNVHTKLEKAHSSLLEQAKKEEVIVTCDVGLTCDILDELFTSLLLLLLLTLLVALSLLPHLLVMFSFVMPH